eukprot:332986-Pelagomonas_calceolata.AAC.2
MSCKEKGASVSTCKGSSPKCMSPTEIQFIPTRAHTLHSIEGTVEHMLISTEGPKRRQHVALESAWVGMSMHLSTPTHLPTQQQPIMLVRQRRAGQLVELQVHQLEGAVGTRRMRAHTVIRPLHEPAQSL